MNNSAVFFSNLRSETRRTISDKVGELLQGLEIGNKIKANDLVAIKLHFGERGNTALVRPIFMRKIVDTIRACGGKPVLIPNIKMDAESVNRSVKKHFHIDNQEGNDYSSNIFFHKDDGDLPHVKGLFWWFYEKALGELF